MTVYYNIPDRKPFVKALEEITGCKSAYLGIPTYAYKVDYFTLTREGNLVFDDMADSEEIEKVLEALASRGFHAEAAEYDTPQPEITEEEPLEDTPLAYGTPEAEDLSLTISLPRSTFTDCQLENLQKLVDAKAPLLKQALAVTELPIIVTTDTVSFPWFKDHIDADSCAAYTCLITSICKMAKEAKRVNMKETTADNSKYAFRCFLLRLGMIGDEHKQNRKILMRNLTGSAAFKSRKKTEVSATSDEQLNEGAKKGGEQ